MSFQCFECGVKGLPDGEVSRGLDALRVERWPEATEILKDAACEVENLSAKFPALIYLDHVGIHKTWPNALVYTPWVGVSVGRCEECEASFPCRNIG